MCVDSWSRSLSTKKCVEWESQGKVSSRLYLISPPCMVPTFTRKQRNSHFKENINWTWKNLTTRELVDKMQHSQVNQTWKTKKDTEAINTSEVYSILRNKHSNKPQLIACRLHLEVNGIMQCSAQHFKYCPRPNQLKKTKSMGPTKTTIQPHSFRQKFRSQMIAILLITTKQWIDETRKHSLKKKNHKYRTKPNQWPKFPRT